MDGWLLRWWLGGEESWHSGMEVIVVETEVWSATEKIESLSHKGLDSILPKFS